MDRRERLELEKEGKVLCNLDNGPMSGEPALVVSVHTAGCLSKLQPMVAVALGHCAASHTGSYSAPVTGPISTLSY